MVKIGKNHPSEGTVLAPVLALALAPALALALDPGLLHFERFLDGCRYRRPPLLCERSLDGYRHRHPWKVGRSRPDERRVQLQQLEQQTFSEGFPAEAAVR